MKPKGKFDSDDWCTPDDLYQVLDDEFHFTFDPCPFHAGFDGLSIDWGARNFINPPYSRQLKERFIRKAFEESQKGRLCVMLLPASTGTKTFHEIIFPHCEIRFLKGRVKFVGINSAGEKVVNRCGMFDSMIVIFNEKRSFCRRQ